MKRGGKRTSIGLLLLLAGAVFLGITLYGLMRGNSLDPQTRVPGEIEFQAPETGRYFLWDNHKTVFEGERVQYPDDFPENATIVALNSSNEEIEFTLEASGGWGIGNHSKSKVGYIDLSAGDSVKFAVDGVDPKRIMSVSKATVGEELWQRLGGFAVGAICCVFGLLSLILGSLSRLRTA